MVQPTVISVSSYSASRPCPTSGAVRLAVVGLSRLSRRPSRGQAPEPPSAHRPAAVALKGCPRRCGGLLPWSAKAAQPLKGARLSVRTAPPARESGRAKALDFLCGVGQSPSALGLYGSFCWVSEGWAIATTPNPGLAAQEPLPPPSP